ncbi:hypothetical protein GGF31_006382 [Allomyces arbusculus]|nr:hypothetical protein GGF31_006382 [Allomyces arbusculus]
MGQAVTQIWDLIRPPKKTRILMLGLFHSGKKTILERMDLRPVLWKQVTIALTVGSIDTRKVQITMWDLGLSEKIPSFYYQPYLKDLGGLIFVTDSADRDLFPDVCREFSDWINKDELKHLPLLVFANKRDLQSAMPVAEMVERLGLKKLATKWHLQESVGLTGEGVFEGMEWFAGVIKEGRAPAVRISARANAYTNMRIKPAANVRIGARTPPAMARVAAKPAVTAKPAVAPAAEVNVAAREHVAAPLAAGVRASTDLGVATKTRIDLSVAANVPTCTDLRMAASMRARTDLNLASNMRARIDLRVPANVARNVAANLSTRMATNLAADVTRCVTADSDLAADVTRRVAADASAGVDLSVPANVTRRVPADMTRNVAAGTDLAADMTANLTARMAASTDLTADMTARRPAGMAAEMDGLARRDGDGDAGESHLAWPELSLESPTIPRGV